LIFFDLENFKNLFINKKKKYKNSAGLQKKKKNSAGLQKKKKILLGYRKYLLKKIKIDKLTIKIIMVEF
jgi:hypothetical protein